MSIQGWPHTRVSYSVQHRGMYTRKSRKSIQQMNNQRHITEYAELEGSTRIHAGIPALPLRVTQILVQVNTTA